MNKLLVTGGMGFVGSNFIRYWLEHHPQDTIVNLDLLTHAGNVENLRSVRDLPNYQFIQGDICSSLLVNKLIAEGFDYIVHFAAESLNEQMIQNPLTVVRSNIEGTQHLLEAVKKEGIRKFIHVSTDEVYGSLKGKCTEQTPLSPNSLYAASKAGADLLVHAYYQIYGLPVVITRCSANYGPYQFPEKLIPLTILNALNGKKLSVYRNGKQVRDWLHVDDHVKALLKVALRGKIGETYNIGGGNEIRNIKLVKKICEILNKLKPSKFRGLKKYEQLITFVKDRPGHDKRYAIDSSKIQKQLNWKPEEKFDNGIKKTVEWYLKNKFLYEKRLTTKKNNKRFK
jgi:dTDP-glucose 4,6-dehydratase